MLDTAKLEELGFPKLQELTSHKLEELGFPKLQELTSHKLEELGWVLKVVGVCAMSKIDSVILDAI